MNKRIYLLALGAFAFGTDVFVMAGVLPVIAHDKGVSIGTTGLLVTVFSLVFGFGAPFLAVFTNHISRNKLLVGVLLGFCVANVLSALSPTFTLLLLTRVLAACCAALYMPNASVIAATLVPPTQRGQALGVVLGGFSIATVLGVPAGTLIGIHIGWQATFLFVVALTLIALLSLLILRLPTIAIPQALDLKARFAPLTNIRMLLALLPALFWACGAFTIYTYISVVLRQTTHVTDPSILLLIYGVGLVIGNWLGGLAADRFGVSRPIIFGLIVLIVTSATLPFTTTTVVSAAFVLGIWGIASLIMVAPQQHRLLSFSAGIPTIIIALSGSISYLGIAAGSGVGNAVLTLTNGSITVLCLIGAAFATVALLSYWLSLRLAPALANVTPHSVMPSNTAPGDKETTLQEKGHDEEVVSISVDKDAQPSEQSTSGN